MKYFTLLLFIVLLACKSSQNKSKDIASVDTINQKSIDTPSMATNNKLKKYTITDITENEYTNAFKSLKDSFLYADFFRLNQNGEETNKYLLKKYSSIAKRNGKNLEINTKVGTKIFMDKVSKNPDIDANDSSHFLIGLNKDFAILQIEYYESDGGKVVDLNTGQDINLWGLSYPSPSGKQMIATSIDPESNMQVNGIQLVNFEEGKWKIKWEEELDGWSVTKPIWIDEKTIYFKEETAATESGTKKAVYKKMMLN